jgi:hypothetical protein
LLFNNYSIAQLQSPWACGLRLTRTFMRLPIVFLTVSFITLFNLAGAPAAAAPVAAAQKAPASAAKAVALVELDTVAVLALSQGDNRAVLGLPDKQMVVVKSGDPVPRTRAVLTQVLGDKLVLDEKSVDGRRHQLVWMYKGQGATPGRIERFATDAAATVVTPAPLRAVVAVKPAPASRSAEAASKP